MPPCRSLSRSIAHAHRWFSTPSALHNVMACSSTHLLPLRCSLLICVRVPESVTLVAAPDAESPRTIDRLHRCTPSATTAPCHRRTASRYFASCCVCAWLDRGAVTVGCSALAELRSRRLTRCHDASACHTRTHCAGPSARRVRTESNEGRANCSLHPAARAGEATLASVATSDSPVATEVLVDVACDRWCIPVTRRRTAKLRSRRVERK